MEIPVTADHSGAIAEIFALAADTHIELKSLIQRAIQDGKLAISASS